MPQGSFRRAPLVAQYISVYVNVDEAEGKAWRKKYGSPGNTLPYVYIIRADGEKLFSHSGIMDSRNFARCCWPKRRTWAELFQPRRRPYCKRLWTKPSGARERRRGRSHQIAAGAQKAWPARQYQHLHGAGSRGQPTCRQVDRGWQEHAARCGREIRGQQCHVCSSIGIRKGKTNLCGIAGVKADLAAADRKYERQRGLAAAIHQAELLDRAEVTAASHNNAKKAAEAFQRIISAYPDTEVAKVAAEDLKKLPDQGPAATAAKSAYRTGRTPRADSLSRHAVAASEMANSRLKPKTVACYRCHSTNSATGIASSLSPSTKRHEEGATTLAVSTVLSESKIPPIDDKALGLPRSHTPSGNEACPTTCLQIG